jgi:hypothetical protein
MYQAIQALVVFGITLTVSARTLEVHIQTRNPTSDRTIVRPIDIETTKTGVVIVDPWDYHWCITWSHLYGSRVPRWNKALECARKLGMQVLWAPTDVASRYVGTPQRERAMGIPYLRVPDIPNVACNFAPAWTPCHCGPGLACRVDYGFAAINPDLLIAQDDLIVAGPEELFSVARKKDLRTLIYMGGATNICLTGKPEGAVRMTNAGLQTMFARDLTEAWSGYDPERGLTAEKGNEVKAAEAERCGIGSIDYVEELKSASLWDPAWVVDTVRMSPWGKKERPYFFEASTVVTLASPYVKNARIVYTLDGSAPARSSRIYDKPFLISETTTVRAAQYRGNRLVTIPTEGLFVRLPAAPHLPDAYLEDLKPIPEPYTLIPGFLGEALTECFWHPRFGRSYDDHGLRVRGNNYKNGIGMLAPANVRYAIRPEFARFTALAGVDDNMLDKNLGRFLASRASVRFHVYIDGKDVGESPVMRMSQEPWRFDIAIPAGARQINLSVSDAGSPSAHDFGNWLNAGFLLRRTASSR